MSDTGEVDTVHVSAADLTDHLTRATPSSRVTNSVFKPNKRAKVDIIMSDEALCCSEEDVKGNEDKVSPANSTPSSGSVSATLVPG